MKQTKSFSDRDHSEVHNRILRSKNAV